MLPAKRMQITVGELLTYIFDDRPHILTAQLADWMDSSARFKEFAATYRDKIRKKIRGTRNAEGLRDLLFELETAYILLQERRFTIEYEKYGVGKARGPDFCVTFKTRILFNLEVTRMRGSDGSVEQHALDRQYEINKLIDTVCGKLGQMLPSMINMLIIVTDDDSIDDTDVIIAMARLKERAEGKESDFFTRKGFSGTSDFFKHYHRLSGLLVRGSSDYQVGKRPILWVNAQAKHSIPAALRAVFKK